VAKKRGTVTAVRAGDFCLFPNGLGSSHFVGTMTDHRRRLRSGGNRTGRVFRNGTSIAMGKIQKSAIELAKLVRREVQEPKIRIGVYAGDRGWNARVYGDVLVTPELQKRIDQAVRELNAIYSLDDL
jgi:hypothetical protein